MLPLHNWSAHRTLHGIAMVAPGFRKDAPTPVTQAQASLSSTVEQESISSSFLARYPEAMNQTTTETPREPSRLSYSTRVKRWLTRFVGRMIVYLAVYLVVSIVSIGPFFWVWFEAVHVDGSVVVAKFYAPLVWLCDHVTWLGELVNRYVNWWIL